MTDLLLWGLDADDLQGYLTAPTGNFREQVAVTAPYKGNRSGKKPEHYTAIRTYLQEEWGFEEVSGMEADDAIAIKATELGNSAVICTTDKDLDQVEGWHFNFVKRNLYHVTREEGLRRFYLQILTGDRVDNIVGLRGIGPVKADRILDGVSEEHALYQRVLEAYEGAEDRVIENGRLLWLKRSPSEPLWLPPHLRQESLSEVQQ